MTKGLFYNGIRVTEIKKISKWTNGAFDADGNKLITASSKRKLLSKLSKQDPPVSKPKSNIKSDVMSLILADKEDAEIVKTIKALYPNSKFNFTHISWYRSTLFRDNIIEAKHAPRRTRPYKDWKASQEI